MSTTEAPTTSIPSWKEISATLGQTPVGKALDDEAERLSWLRETAVDHAEQGRWMEWSRDLGMVLDGDLRSRRFGDLRSSLDAADARVSVRRTALPAEVRVLLRLYRGHLEFNVGNLRGALDAYSPADAPPTPVIRELSDDPPRSNRHEKGRRHQEQSKRGLLRCDRSGHVTAHTAADEDTGFV